MAKGVVRKFDGLGRIVIPKEWRDELNLQKGDPYEIILNGNNITVRKYEPFCAFCGKSDHLLEHSGIKVCPQCVKKILAKAENV